MCVCLYGCVALFICLHHQRFSIFARQITNNKSMKLSHATFNVNQCRHYHCLLLQRQRQRQRSNLPKSFAKTATNRKLISLLSNFTLANVFYFILFIIKHKNCRNESTDNFGRSLAKEKNQQRKKKTKKKRIIQFRYHKSGRRQRSFAAICTQCVLYPISLFGKCSYLNL